MKRLGDHPIVVAFSSRATRVELAASGEQRDELLGWEQPDNAQSSPARHIPREPDARLLGGRDQAH